MGYRKSEFPVTSASTGPIFYEVACHCKGRKMRSKPKGLKMTYKFSVGDKVRIKTESYNDRKRVPRYIMGKVGEVEIVRGCFSNPLDHREERPPIYSVGFDQEQISPQGSKQDKIIVDVFEDWMTAE